MAIFDLKTAFAPGGGSGESIRPMVAQITGMPAAPQKQTIEGAGEESLQAIQQGLGQATGTLSPLTSQAGTLTPEITKFLMGGTPNAQIPGVENMLMARREAIGDLGTGMAGTGKFFSGSTAEQASEIGGAMSNQLRQQYLNNLMRGAAPGQNAMGQLAGIQMGAGTASAQIPLELQRMLMQQEQFAQQMKEQQSANQAGFVGDLLGAAATALPFLSDVRLKENIKRIGKKGPYNWYQFTYKGDDKTYEGVMAQEVSDINPEAVIEQDGYLMVDYARL